MNSYFTVPAAVRHSITDPTLCCAAACNLLLTPLYRQFIHATPNPCPVVMADIVVGAGFMTPSDIVAVGNEYINGGMEVGPCDLHIPA